MEMSEILICENTILGYKYKYFLIEKLCKIESVGTILRYGIKVKEYDVKGKLIDSKAICDIFGNKLKMIKAIGILKKLEVTPITLEDVVIDNIY